MGPPLGLTYREVDFFYSFGAGLERTLDGWGSDGA